jgi:Ca2+-binding RTX toxin-like protein
MSGSFSSPRSKAVLIAIAFAASFVVLFLALRAVASEDKPATTKVGLRGLTAAEQTGSAALQLADVKLHDPLANQNYAPDQLIVRFDSDATATERADAREAVNGDRGKGLSVPGTEVLDLPKNSNEKLAAEKLSHLPGVKYAETNGVMRTTATPNDAKFVEQWDFNNTGQNGGIPDADIDAPEAWDRTTGNPNVVTAVVDTGVDYGIADLSENIWQNSGETGLDSQSHDKRSNGIDDDSNGYVDDWHGWNFAGGAGAANDPMDDNFHGTHVAGTIAARGNNGIGVAGVTWNTKVMPVKVLNAGGSGYNSTIADGMAYASNNGARVINMSLGGPGFSQYMSDVVSSHPQTLFVVAAGNDTNNNDTQTHFYPCNLPQDNLICVAATNSSDQLAYFSNFGPNAVDLAAPGEDILSTKATVSNRAGDYISLSGTSMASPHVAGAAALLLSSESTATSLDLRQALLDGTDGLGTLIGKVDSGGRLNLNSALTKLDAIIHRNPAVTTVEVSSTHDLRYYSGTGLTNDIDVTKVGNELQVTDVAGANIQPIGACYVVNSSTARCPAAGVRRAVIRSFDGNDDITNATTLASSIDAGAGNDAVHGGSGDDAFTADAGSDSYSGGGGIDSIDYSPRTAAVTVTLNGVANDGGSGELDNVGADVETVLGGSGNDTLTAGSTAVTLSGGAGDDVLTGSAGADTIADGRGADTVNAGSGDDTLNVTNSDGDDSWSGGIGTDTVYLNNSTTDAPTVTLNDVANDGNYPEADNYRSDIENLIGGDGWDSLTGNASANVISGGSGVNTINGGSGGADVLSGGGSLMDTVDFSDRTASVAVSLDGIANDGSPGQGANVANDFEKINGGSGNDTLTGGDGTNEPTWITLDGTVRQGDETLDGGPGADVLSGGGGGHDVASYRNRSEPITATLDNTANDGAAGENDRIATDVHGVIGGSGNDTLTGGSGSDELDGGYNGNDTLNGSGGDDILDGGAPGGTDTYIGGSGFDYLDYAAPLSTDRYAWSYPVSVTLDGVNNDGYPGNNDVLGSDIEKFRGGGSTNTLVGNSSDNVLLGGRGVNTISGGGGNDTLTGGWNFANDQISGDAGNDTIFTAPYSRYIGYYWDEEGSSTYFFGGGADHALGGDGNDTIEGGLDSDALEGGNGDDEFDPSYGADVVSGGAGTDGVTYRNRGEALSLSLDGVANDGAISTLGGSYEKDNLGTDVENLTGGLYFDELIGNDQPNRFDGDRDKDHLVGNGGNDTLIGNEGVDNLDGGAGDDTLRAADNTGDTVTCGADVDSVERDTEDTVTADCENPANTPSIAYEVASGFDTSAVRYSSPQGVTDNVTVSAASGVLTFQATGHNLLARVGCVQVAATTVTCPQPSVFTATLYAYLGDGNDRFIVNDTVTMNSKLYPGTGNDVVRGGAGYDRLFADTGADQLAGGAGERDSIDYRGRSNGLSVSLDGIANDGELGELDNVATDVEDVFGGSGNDVLTGNTLNNHLFGEKGNDSFDGGLGADWMIGREGDDQATYASRTAPVNIAPSDYAPENYLYVADQIAHGSGVSGEGDWFGSDIEKLIGGSGNDTIHCSLGFDPKSNVLDGGAGADTFSDCTKDEVSTADSVSYSDRSTAVSVTLDGAGNDGASGEGDNISAGIENISGGSGNDSFTGNSEVNSFAGNAGDDTFLISDATADNADCGEGADTVTADSLDNVSDNCETVNSPIGTSVVVAGSTIRYRTNASVTNTIDISSTSGYVAIHDAATAVDAGPGCVATNTQTVTCALPAAAKLDVNTAGGNDSITNNTGLALKADAGGGNDTVVGGGGNDTLDGGLGADVINGGLGTDLANYSTRSARVKVYLDAIANDGEVGEGDLIGSDIENVTTGTGDDLIYGDDNPNALSSGSGSDTVLGRRGNDVLDGGAGIDWVSYAYEDSDIVVNLLSPWVPNGVTSINENDTLIAFENAEGGNGRDSVVGSDTANSLSGGPSDDWIDGNAGNDQLQGGAGNDSFNPGDGDDTSDGGDDNDNVVSGPGADTFVGGQGIYDSASYMNESANHNVTLDGVANDGAAGEHDNIKTDVEVVNGGTGDDVLTGNAGDNSFFGYTGNDTISGGLGADQMNGGDGDDTVTYAGRTEALKINTWYQQSGAVGELDSVGSDFDHIIGGSGDDEILGFYFDSSGNPTVDGGAGNDSLFANLNGGTLIGGSGSDAFSGWSGADTIKARDGEVDSIYCGDNTDTVIADPSDTYSNVTPDCENIDTTTPPTLTIQFPTGALVNGQNVQVLFDAEAGSTTTCSLNNAAPAPCASGDIFGPLLEGDNTIMVTATDPAGNSTSKPATVTLDSIPPALNVTFPGPNTSTSGNSIQVQFTAEAGATTTCALNSGSANDCVSGSTIGPLDEGINTITIVASDAAGNTTTKTPQVTRDTNPPNTYLDSFAVNDPTATAAFHGSEAGLTYQCRIDGGTWVTCTSPYTTPALASGTHTFEVRAIDGVNNADASPVSKSFTVNVPGSLSRTSATAPSSVNLATTGTLDWAHWGSTTATSFDHKSSGGSQISNISLVGSGAALTRLSGISPASTWTGGTPTAASTSTTQATGVSVGGATGRGFSFTVPGGSTASRTLNLYVGAASTTAKIELSLADGSASAITDTTSLVASTSIPVNKLITIKYRPSSSSALNVKVTTQSTGSVRLYSAALAADADTTAPDTAITVPSVDGSVITTPTTAATVTSTESGSTLQCKIDTGAYVVVTSPYTTPSLGDGLHTLRCRSIDVAGNVDASPAVRTFWIAMPISRLSAPAPAIQTAAVNLTTEGTLDWTHYGLSSASLTPSRKSGANVIGAATQLGGGTLARLTSGVPPKTWTGGTPTASATNSTTGLSYNTANPGVVGRGFQLTVPALTNQLRQLKLYVGVTNTTGKLEASLDDGSGMLVTDTSVTNAAGTTNVVYTINFRASAASKNLTVKWTQNTTAATGRVSFQSATLSNNADTTQPLTTITSGPADGSVITTPTATFGFSSNEGGSSFQCRVDEGAYLSCATPFTTGTLSDGVHTFDVRALDAAGNLSSQPPRRTFTKQ